MWTDMPVIRVNVLIYWIHISKPKASLMHGIKNFVLLNPAGGKIPGLWGNFTSAINDYPYLTQSQLVLFSPHMTLINVINNNIKFKEAPLLRRYFYRLGYYLTGQTTWKQIKDWINDVSCHSPKAAERSVWGARAHACGCARARLCDYTIASSDSRHSHLLEQLIYAAQKSAGSLELQKQAR